VGAQNNLDNPELYPQIDAGGMLEHLHNFPRLCEQAWRMAMDFSLPANYQRAKKIVILGMGGSAIGGDLVSSLCSSESKVPILVCREYDLPKYVDAETLVIASSYSGMTEETMSAFTQAVERGAKKLAITTGGKLKSFCEKEKIPYIIFDYSSQPRAALPFSFFISLGILQRLDFVSDKSMDVSEAVFKLQNLTSEINEKVATAQNPAKALAEKLYGRLPIVYGAGITSEVAHRWKGQLNENSKTMAFYELFSELNHNAIVGYSFPEEVTHQSMVVILDSSLVHDRNRLRIEVTRNLLEQAGIYCHVLRGEGESALSQMATLILLGDYVSYYLALLNQVDPTPVKPIEFLKNQLARS
jgi:glucose/mannose-6-phosphate isomerase